jgi:TP901 family phage tail tape measure protein
MNIGTLIVTLGADVSGLDRATKSLNTTAQRFRTFGYLASAAITAPMVMASKNAIKMGMDFEFTLKKMIGLAGVAKSSLEQISKEVKDLAANTGIAAQNVAEAYYYVASSWIKGANVLEVTKMAAKGAASGMGEVSDLAKLLTAGMNAYAAEGLKVNEMMDTLTATIRVGKAEPAEMVNALGTILPIAQKLGLDIQDVGGALATMTLITNSTATSATYLRNMLMKLLDPAPQVRDAMESMGISMEQIHALLKTPNGFIKTMELLGATTEKYGVTMDALFPEMRSLLGALNFTGEGLKRLQENTDEVNKSTGVFQAHFEEMSTTMKMRWNKAVVAGKNAVTDLGVSLAMGVVPILEKLVKGLENVTKWFNSLTEAQKRHKLILLAIIALLGPLSLAISVLMYAVSGLVSVVTGFTKVMATLRLIAISNPWILIATAIATLVGVLIGARNKTKDFADEQNKLKDTLIDVNGEMKKMKDLAEVDYSKMTLTSLSQAYVTAWGAAAEAKKKYDALVAARGGETKFNAWLKAGKYNILEEAVLKDWLVAKNVVNSVAEAMDNYTNKTEIATTAIKKQKDVIIDQYNALKDLKGFLSTIDTESMIQPNYAVGAPAFMESYKSILGFKEGLAPAPIMSKDVEAANQSLMRQQNILNTLTNTFANMFMSVGTGWKNMIDVMIEGFKRLIAQILAKIVVLGLITLLFPGTPFAAKALSGLMDPMKLLGIGGAKGGIVPSGYLNDSYPLRATSQEALIPLDKLSSLINQSEFGGKVVFEIHQDKLVGILEKAYKKNSLY